MPTVSWCFLPFVTFIDLRIKNFLMTDDDLEFEYLDIDHFDLYWRTSCDNMDSNSGNEDVIDRVLRCVILDFLFLCPFRVSRSAAFQSKKSKKIKTSL